MGDNHYDILNSYVKFFFYLLVFIMSKKRNRFEYTKKSSEIFVHIYFFKYSIH